MAEEFDGGKEVFKVFNDVTSKHQSSGASYASYPFKGLYGLLLLNMKQYHLETYRGLSYPMEAEKNTFIRFNRFLSTSANKTVAIDFAGSKGTVFVIKGKKKANYITPYSQIEGEDEYLISPDAKFLILEVQRTTKPVVITMQTVEYS